VDWSDPANAPAKPALLGTKAYLDFPIEELLPYIDWNPFFQARGVERGGAQRGT
jgi:5-methyltetrahydrofolate--homocysteine methyltransferase